MAKEGEKERDVVVQVCLDRVPPGFHRISIFLGYPIARIHLSHRSVELISAFASVCPSFSFHRRERAPRIALRRLSIQYISPMFLTMFFRTVAQRNTIHIFYIATTSSQNGVSLDFLTPRCSKRRSSSTFLINKFIQYFYKSKNPFFHVYYESNMI